ncbi:hypothetical protein HDV00_001322 [Rhizophlyctis rosea]|nr:hypothetical protein HDV00_001322 [Rhizophlyctis rosea]
MMAETAPLETRRLSAADAPALAAEPSLFSESTPTPSAGLQNQPAVVASPPASTVVTNQGVKPLSAVTPSVPYPGWYRENGAQPQPQPQHLHPHAQPQPQHAYPNPLLQQRSMPSMPFDHHPAAFHPCQHHPHMSHHPQAPDPQTPPPQAPPPQNAQPPLPTTAHQAGISPSKRRSSRPNIVVPHWQGPPEPSPLHPPTRANLSQTHRSAQDISMGMRGTPYTSAAPPSQPGMREGVPPPPGSGNLMRHQSMPQLYDRQQQAQQGYGQPGFSPAYMHPRGSYQLGIDSGEGLEPSGVMGASFQNLDKQSIYNVATKVLDGLESVGSKLVTAVNAAANKYGLMSEDQARFQNEISNDRRRQSMGPIPHSNYNTGSVRPGMVQPIQSGGLYQPPLQRASSYLSHDPTSLV